MAILGSLGRWILRRRSWFLALAGVYGLYLAFGFLILPGILKGRLEKALSEATHRRATIQRVRVNPFVISATVEGLSVADRRGGPWVGCERIYANLQLLPLLGRTVELKALELTRPALRIELDPQGRPDFADLLELPPAQAPAAPSPWTFAVDRFVLTEGRVPFLDRSTDPDFRTEVGPLSFRLDGFRSVPGSRGGASFQALTGNGESLSWEGSLGLDPLLATGGIRLERLDLAKYGPYLKESLSLELRKGRMDLGARYRIAWGPQEKSLRVEEGSLRLEGLELGEAGSASAVLLPELTLSGVSADLLADKLRADRLSAQGGRLALDRDKAGGLNLQRLFSPPPGRRPKPPGKPLDLGIRELSLSRFAVAWRDAQPARPVALDLEDVDLTLRDFSLEAQRPASLAFRARIKEGGRLSLEGPVRPLAVAADLKVEAEALSLPPFEAYLEAPLDLRLGSGKVGLKGKLRASFEGRKGDGASYAGDAWIDQFEASDGRDREVALRWKRLALRGLEARSAPLSIKLKSLDWEAPEGRLVVAPDGSTNVARMLGLGSGAQPVTGAATPPSAKAGEAPMPLSIALLKVAGGRLGFVDRSLSPNAALLLSDLEGSYVQLSTEPGARSQLRFTGKAGGVGPLRVEGQAYPLRTDLDTDLRMTLQGAELTDLDPYSRKFLGYLLQKGKLNVDLSLGIQQRKLKAEVKAKLDQLYLGDKVESKDATWIPVKLALALIRDRNGVIELELPVDGSLDDPDFHYGRMIWKVLLNVLSKAATSPFQLLGKLFGGGADLSSVAFAPASAELSPESGKVLSGLVKSLQERPGIGLELEGAADPVADAAELKRRGLEGQVRGLAWKQAGKTGRVEEAFAPSPAQREAALRGLHSLAFPVDPKAPKVAEAPLAEVETRLLGQMKVGPEELRSLAEARGEAVRAALAAAGAPMDRVFAVKGTLRPEQGCAPKVWFAVK